MALRSRIDHIVERLQAAVKETLPSADELTFTQLRDHLPKTLEQMATALEATHAGPTRTFLSDSGEHGVCRYHQSFNLRELLVEYSLIRSILIEEVARSLNRPLKVEEIVTLIVGVDAAARRAVGLFVENMNLEIQSAAESHSKYLSFLSHDLRGSLNGTLLMIEVLKRELSGVKQFSSSIEDLDMMRRSILDTVGTMDRFLHAERFRKGKVEAKLGLVNLASLATEVVGQISHTARAKGVDLAVDTSQCPQTISDRELLTMILQNLVGNAVKYSASGTVRIMCESAASGCCRISVSDEGPGIPSDRLGQLFTPFTRGETYGQKGLGLGLSIARQAADLLKARLWAESKPGKGSTFILELPKLDADGQKAPE